MTLKHCKSRAHFLKDAFDGQLIECLWPSESNPPEGWESDQKNRRRGELRLPGHVREVPMIEFANGSRVELPPKEFWYQPRGDK